MNSEEAQDKDETDAELLVYYSIGSDTEVDEEREELEVLYGGSYYDIYASGDVEVDVEKPKKKRQKKKESPSIQVFERTTQNTVVEKTPQKYPSTTPPKATKDKGIDGEGQPVLLERSSRRDPQALVYAVGQLVG